MVADRHNLPNDLMPGHSRQNRLWQFTIHQMQVGTAYATSEDF